MEDNPAFNLNICRGLTKLIAYIIQEFAKDNKYDVGWSAKRRKL